MLGNELGGHQGWPVDAVCRAARRAATDAEQTRDSCQCYLRNGVGDGTAHLALVGVFQRDAPERDGFFVAGGIDLVGANDSSRNACEIISVVRTRLPERSFDEFGFCFDIETGECDGHVVTEPAHLVHCHLEGAWWWLTFSATDTHAVAGDLLELDGVEASRHIGTQIRRATNFVEQL